jgi:stage V sporulation protein K
MNFFDLIPSIERVIIMLNLNFVDYRDNENMIIEKFKRGDISITEAFNLLTGMGSKNAIKINKPGVNPVIEERDKKFVNDKEKLDELLKEMDRLVELTEIKKIIREYLAFIEIQNLRKKYKLKTQPVVMHMIFKGNPGTGKTTMARIIGKIFKEVGFLNKGEVIEAERSDLVGEYIGHTAQKTKKLIEKALGGVLFIDEAYSLARGGEKDFGKEAIDTMVKAMEDYKDDLIIILAGYREEMNYFLECNPGLRSRFAIQIDFPDYSIDQLVEIAEMMYSEREYVLDKESKHYIYRVLTKLRNEEGLNNGNARTVRNLVERSIRHQAQRVVNSSQINRQSLMYIKKEDLIGEEVIDE